MRWFAMSLVLLSFSLSSYGDNEPKVFQGSGTEIDEHESKSPYTVETKITKTKESSNGNRYLIIKTHIVLEDGSYKGKTVRLMLTGSDSFTIVDADGDRLGWGYEIEFESENAPKVYALMLNYRASDKPDSNTVSQLIRFVRGENTVTSTGSVIDSDGKMISAWSSESQG